MSRLKLFSEPFAPTGNIAGEGFGRLLGRPALGQLQTVVRESLQNSLDAARLGKPPSVHIRFRYLEPAQAATLRQELLGNLPEEHESSTLLTNSLNRDRIPVLEICDFNTAGLGGPLRADVPAANEKPDFVNFMRNVGAVRDSRQGSGGTYGYGKTALYAFSHCATILVDSQTEYRGQPVRRLIGCHLGHAFNGRKQDGSQRRYTGRHWWGIPDESEGINPMEGMAASALAAELGLPYRADGAMGTSIVIIDPRVDDDDDDEQDEQRTFESRLLEALLWNFWPRMTDSTPAERRLDVRIELNGNTLSVPKPEEFPPLDLFSEALATLREGSAASTTSITHGKGRKLMGSLAIQKGMRAKRQFPATLEGSAFPGQCAKIALMRPVELVVRYIDGEPFPDQRFEWAGVFICSDEHEVEAAFASAEPPAHDDWIPDSIPRDRERSWVNVTLRELRKTAREYSNPARRELIDNNVGPSLASTATRLGQALANGSSRGPGVPATPNRPSNGGNNSNGSVLSPATFERLEQGPNGDPEAVFTATLRGTGGSTRLVVEATPMLMMDGGSTTTTGLGESFQPSIRSMSMPEAGIASSGNQLPVKDDKGTIEIRMRMPAMAAASVRLQLMEE